LQERLAGQPDSALILADILAYFLADTDRAEGREGNMTEAEWLACEDPFLMMDFVGGKVEERKLWLFGCACCRRIWNAITDPRSRAAVEFAEQYVDSGRTSEQLRQAPTVWDTDDPNGEQSRCQGSELVGLIGFARAPVSRAGRREPGRG
jgi:hypothetical protein